MASVDEAKAALKVAELEAELVAAKTAGDDKQTQRVKYRLRDARQAHRDLRSPVAGDARPEPIRAKAKAES